MTCTNLTRIAVILDRSGSMSAIHAATIRGFNEFIAKLQSQPGEASLKLVQFDDHYETLFDTPLHACRQLTMDDCVPRASTALNDAIGRTIDDLGRELRNMPEAQRPDKVICMIMTDGVENASQEYSGSRIASMIQRQTITYDWKFMYLGANQDAIGVSGDINIPRGSAVTFAANNFGIQHALSSAGTLLNAMRNVDFALDPGGVAGSNLEFTEQDRAQALADTEDPDEAIESGTQLASRIWSNVSGLGRQKKQNEEALTK